MGRGEVVLLESRIGLIGIDWLTPLIVGYKFIGKGLT